MSYYSEGVGELTLSRSLVWGEYCYSPYLFRPESSTDLVFRNCVEISYTSEGQEGHCTATHVEWRDSYESKKRKFPLELIEIACQLQFFGVTVSGWLIRSGENSGDVERYTIVGSAVLTEHAVLRWPDGSTV